MSPLLPGPQLTSASWIAYGAVVLLSWLLRSRSYALFRAVTLPLHLLIALAIFPEARPWREAFFYLHLTVFIDAAALIWPRLRPALYRTLVALPAQYFAASTLMAWPWAVAAALGFHLPLLAIPYALGLFGLYQSLSARKQSLKLSLSPDTAVPRLSRWTGAQAVPHQETHPTRTLRIAQITDPHLGPFMTPARLRRICERVVEQDPDLVFLTGDFLTMETQRDPSWLASGLAPLAALSGRVVACMGNHDHEAPGTVRRALEQISARLLIDEELLIETEKGAIQVIGLDFHFHRRAEIIPEVMSRFPRRPGVPRLVLLHDPGAFRHLPNGEADLVFSGHTHGGQVGLVSFGNPLTVVSWLAKIPDHGLWALGTNRLYVHRGTGHYGFPFRLGVPAEESLLLLPLEARAAT